MSDLRFYRLPFGQGRRQFEKLYRFIEYLGQCFLIACFNQCARRFVIARLNYNNQFSMVTAPNGDDRLVVELAFMVDQIPRVIRLLVGESALFERPICHQPCFFSQASASF